MNTEHLHRVTEGKGALLTLCIMLHSTLLWAMDHGSKKKRCFFLGKNVELEEEKTRIEGQKEGSKEMW